ncbi:MAG: hypothetical protein H6581_01195 [Bacteroidia bacterium]|nr:hypothetical protein [Bacteroidia bacterium]
MAALLSLAGCQLDEPLPSLHKKYLFAGHCYEFKDPENGIDPRIKTLNLNSYDHFTLGGDVLFEGVRDQASLDALDEVVDLSSPKTHWALGNHDLLAGHQDWIEEKTGRPSFYSFHQDGVTFVLLNTNILKTDCPNLDEQYAMLQSVCDTLQKSSHLVLLMHHVIWGKVIDGGTLGVANGDNPWFHLNCASPTPYFDLTAYPLLTSVRQRGIKVLVISGDLGQQKQQFEYITPEGIVFLGAGLNKSATLWFGNTYRGNDAMIVLHHDLAEKTLDWEFVKIDSL